MEQRLAALFASIGNALDSNTYTYSDSDYLVRKILVKFLEDENALLASARHIPDPEQVVESILNYVISTKFANDDPASWYRKAMAITVEFADFAHRNDMSEDSARYAALLPDGHPRVKRVLPVTASSARQSLAEWMAADPRLDAEAAEQVRKLYSLDDSADDVEAEFQTLKAEALVAAGRMPEDLLPIVAAFNLSFAQRSAISKALAAVRRRDRKGRFAREFGRLKLFFKSRGEFFSSSPRIVGPGRGENTYQVESKGDPNIPDGIYEVDAALGENVKAYLPKSAVKGLAKRKEVVAEDDKRFAIELDDFLKTKQDVPNNWNKSGNKFVTKDGKFTATKIDSDEAQSFLNKAQERGDDTIISGTGAADAFDPENPESFLVTDNKGRTKGVAQDWSGIQEIAIANGAEFGESGRGAPPTGPEDRGIPAPTDVSGKPTPPDTPGRVKSEPLGRPPRFPGDKGVPDPTDISGLLRPPRFPGDTEGFQPYDGTDIGARDRNNGRRNKKLQLESDLGRKLNPEEIEAFDLEPESVSVVNRSSSRAYGDFLLPKKEQDRRKKIRDSVQNEIDRIKDRKIVLDQNSAPKRPEGVSKDARYFPPFQPFGGTREPGYWLEPSGEIIFVDDDGNLAQMPRIPTKETLDDVLDNKSSLSDDMLGEGYNLDKNGDGVWGVEGDDGNYFELSKLPNGGYEITEYRDYGGDGTNTKTRSESSFRPEDRLEAFERMGEILGRGEWDQSWVDELLSEQKSGPDLSQDQPEIDSRIQIDSSRLSPELREKYQETFDKFDQAIFNNDRQGIADMLSKAALDNDMPDEVYGVLSEARDWVANREAVVENSLARASREDLENLLEDPEFAGWRDRLEQAMIELAPFGKDGYDYDLDQDTAPVLSEKQAEPATGKQYSMLKEFLDERNLDPATEQALTDAIENKNLNKAQASALIGLGRGADFKEGVDPTKPSERMLNSLMGYLATKDLTPSEINDTLKSLEADKSRDNVEALLNKLRRKKDKPADLNQGTGSMRRIDDDFYEWEDAYNTISMVRRGKWWEVEYTTPDRENRGAQLWQLKSFEDEDQAFSYAEELVKQNQKDNGYQRYMDDRLDLMVRRLPDPDLDQDQATKPSLEDAASDKQYSFLESLLNGKKIDDPNLEAAARSAVRDKNLTKGEVGAFIGALRNLPDRPGARREPSAKQIASIKRGIIERDFTPEQIKEIEDKLNSGVSFEEASGIIDDIKKRPVTAQGMNDLLDKLSKDQDIDTLRYLLDKPEYADYRTDIKDTLRQLALDTEGPNLQEFIDARGEPDLDQDQDPASKRARRDKFSEEFVLPDWNDLTDWQKNALGDLFEDSFFKMEDEDPQFFYSSLLEMAEDLGYDREAKRYVFSKPWKYRREYLEWALTDQKIYSDSLRESAIDRLAPYDFNPKDYYEEIEYSPESGPDLDQDQNLASKDPKSKALEDLKVGLDFSELKDVALSRLEGRPDGWFDSKNPAQDTYGNMGQSSDWDDKYNQAYKETLDKVLEDSAVKKAFDSPPAPEQGTDEPDYNEWSEDIADAMLRSLDKYTPGPDLDQDPRIEEYAETISNELYDQLVKSSIGRAPFNRPKDGIYKSKDGMVEVEVVSDGDAGPDGRLVDASYFEIRLNGRDLASGPLGDPEDLSLDIFKAILNMDFDDKISDEPDPDLDYDEIDLNQDQSARSIQTKDLADQISKELDAIDFYMENAASEAYDNFIAAESPTTAGDWIQDIRDYARERKVPSELASKMEDLADRMEQELIDRFGIADSARYNNDDRDVLYIDDVVRAVEEELEMFFETDADKIAEILEDREFYGDNRSGGAEASISENEDGTYTARVDYDRDSEEMSFEDKDEALAWAANQVRDYNFQARPRSYALIDTLEEEYGNAKSPEDALAFADRIQGIAEDLESNRGDRDLANSLRDYGNRMREMAEKRQEFLESQLPNEPTTPETQEEMASDPDLNPAGYAEDVSTDLFSQMKATEGPNGVPEEESFLSKDGRVEVTVNPENGSYTVSVDGQSVVSGDGDSFEIADSVQRAVERYFSKKD